MWHFVYPICPPAGIVVYSLSFLKKEIVICSLGCTNACCTLHVDDGAQKGLHEKTLSQFKVNSSEKL